MADDEARLPLTCRFGVHRYRRRHVMGALYEWTCTHCSRKWNR